MRLRNLFLALLLFLATVTPAYADDIPHDVGSGISYDTVRVDVLGVSPHLAGEAAAIVVQTRWSDLSYVAPESAAGTVIVHWPRGENDTARAADAATFFTPAERGIAVIGYHVPAEVLLPGESVVTATVEVRVLAIAVTGWPSFGWGSTDFVVTIGRAD